jgi:hypothetical protein
MFSDRDGGSGCSHETTDQRLERETEKVLEPFVEDILKVLDKAWLTAEISPTNDPVPSSDELVSDELLENIAGIHSNPEDDRLLKPACYKYALLRAAHMARQPGRSRNWRRPSAGLIMLEAGLIEARLTEINIDLARGFSVSYPQPLAEQPPPKVKQPLITIGPRLQIVPTDTASLAIRSSTLEGVYDEPFDSHLLLNSVFELAYSTSYRPPQVST